MSLYLKPMVSIIITTTTTTTTNRPTAITAIVGNNDQMLTFSVCEAVMTQLTYWIQYAKCAKSEPSYENNSTYHRLHNYN